MRSAAFRGGAPLASPAKLVAFTHPLPHLQLQGTGTIDESKHLETQHFALVLLYGELKSLRINIEPTAFIAPTSSQAKNSYQKTRLTHTQSHEELEHFAYQPTPTTRLKTS